MAGYKMIQVLADEAEMPQEGILSRPLWDGPDAKVVLFAFSRGQELSEHTASKPAILHFLAGEAELLLGEDRVTAGPGTWVRMEPGLRHAVKAKTDLRMLLTLVKG